MKAIKKRKGVLGILSLAVIAIAGVWAVAAPDAVLGPAEMVPESAPDFSRLVSVQELPAMEACAMDAPRPARANADLVASLQPTNLFGALRPSTSSVMGSVQGQRDMPRGRDRQRGDRPPPAEPLRTITREPVFRILGDSYPTYTAIGVNTQTNEVVLQDNNLWSTRVFNRLDNTPPGADLTEAKRVIQGDETHIQFNNGVYVDPENGDIYSVESDTGDRMVVFSQDQSGNVAPKRLLNTPHRVYSIAVDEEREELYVTVEYPPQIVVYRKEADGDEPPLRVIEGPRTRLEAPHGIAVDTENQLLYVNHWGQAAEYATPGTGRFNDPGINVYPLLAEGDTAPLRVIEGDRTELNWPGNMALNPDNGELYVANDMGHSILVFAGMSYIRGNVPPTRAIKGDRTRLSYPTGVAIDRANQELWVSNLGNASAVAYPLMADGNVEPLRVIRSAPAGHESLTFGRTAAVAYDPNRQEILVPN